MKFVKPTLIAATLAVAVGSAYVLAEPGKHGKARFPIDLNAAEQRATERFDAVDTNDDELISAAEFQAQEQPARKHRKHAWHGGDGHYRHKAETQGKGRSEEEREQRRAARAARKAEFEAAVFNVMDTNNDGQLSAEEAGQEQRKAARQQVFKDRMFQRLDADDSGSLTRSEFSARLQRLRQADTDGNGEISRDEARTMRAAHRQHRADA